MGESFLSRVDPTDGENPHDDSRQSRGRALAILVWAILLNPNDSPATGREQIRVAGSASGKAARRSLQQSWALEQASSLT
jgi:hypothetical protein